MNLIVLTLIASLFYSLSTAHVVRKLFDKQGPNQKKTLLLSTVAILLHLAVLVNSIFTESGQNLSFANVALLICWLIVVSVTTVSLRYPATLLLPVVYGFAAILLVFSLFLPHHVVLPSINFDIALLTHISLSFMAYCVLVIATLFAIQFHFINRRLKQKDMSIVSSHLPPLMFVERQLFYLVTMGSVLLTFALVSGFVFLENMFATNTMHKTVLSLISWLLFCTVAWGHRYLGWRGKSSVITTIIAAILLTLAYFGSRFVQEIILGRI
jgi:ABC-type uncharacterized transport system permease subunit